MHLATQMNVRRSTADPEYDAQVNILGTLNLMKNVVRYGIQKVIFASSGGTVYGEQDTLPATELHPTNPLSPYGVSKLAGEHYLAVFQSVAGVPFVTLRYGNVYEPRQEPEGEAGVVAIFTETMLRGEQPIINGKGHQTRDYIFVEDVVKATVTSMKPHVHGIYNVGTGKETTVNGIFNILKKITKTTCKKLHGPPKKGEQLRSVLDSTKLQKVLGWKPEVPIEEGLRRTVESFMVVG